MVTNCKLFSQNSIEIDTTTAADKFNCVAKKQKVKSCKSKKIVGTERRKNFWEVLKKLWGEKAFAPIPLYFFVYACRFALDPLLGNALIIIVNL